MRPASDEQSRMQQHSAHDNSSETITEHSVNQLHLWLILTTRVIQISNQNQVSERGLTCMSLYKQLARSSDTNNQVNTLKTGLGQEKTQQEGYSYGKQIARQRSWSTL